jgi:hypothetical protein
VIVETGARRAGIGQAQRHTIPLPAIPSVEHPLCGRMRGFDRLDDFEPFEFRLAKCERLALARVLMGGAELFRLGPCRKILLRRPWSSRSGPRSK